MTSTSPNSKSLSIVILGTRGIPASYGGFETFAEELSTRLSQRGHHVTVFGRNVFSLSSNSNSSSEKLNSYKGVSLRYAFTVANKYLETPVHAFCTNLKLLLDRILSLKDKPRYDVALLCNAANSPFAFMINWISLPLAINVDGIERNRTKWNSLGKAWYLLGEWCSTKFANQVIGDADVICEYYKERYGLDSVMIPYGASVNKTPPGSTLKTFNLSPNQYILYVSRLEPENNALGVIQAYCKLKGENLPKLVIVGDAPYAKQYKESLFQAANENVIFTGYQFGEAYCELQSNCMFYVQATEVGGTHPALVEAMAYGNAIIANGTEENIEVLGDSGLIYSKNNFEDLSAKLEYLINSKERRDQLGSSANLRAENKYSWQAVCDTYESLFLSLAESKAS